MNGLTATTTLLSEISPIANLSYLLEYGRLVRTSEVDDRQELLLAGV